MANPIEEEFGTFDRKVSNDNPIAKEFGSYNVKAPSQKTSVGASDVVPEERNLVERIADSAGAGFMSANLEGFGGLVARKGFEMSGYGIDKLKEQFPGKPDEWYKSKQKAIINQTMLDARKSESKKIEDANLNIPGTNINPVAFAGGMAGGADPTYAVGGGLAKNIVGSGAKAVAKRVGIYAAEQAGLGAATDAAYQGADILDGLQTKFNVQRNLTNAVFGGAVGGTIGGAHEISPFVSGLFEKRKIDTTPAADPRPVADATTPTTGGTPLTSFQERAKEALKNGSEQDIHDLFKGSNIPAPWRRDTAEFVARRDANRASGVEPTDPDLTPAVDERTQASPVWDKTREEASALQQVGLAEPDPHLPQNEQAPTAANPIEAEHGPFQSEEAAPEASGGDLEAIQRAPSSEAAPLHEDHIPGVDDEAPYTRQEAQEHIANLTKDWKNAPEFEVVDHVDQVADPATRQYLMDHDPDGDAMGLYGKDGKVRIFADRVPDRATMNAIVFHEALGHHGLSEHFGDRMDSVLQTLMDRNVGSFNKSVDDWMKQYPGEYGGSRVRAAEEVLARMSEGGQIKPALFDAMAKVVRDFARKNLGLKLAISDAEIKVILSMAHRSVVDGTGRNVAANGFRTGGRTSIDENGTFDARLRKDDNVVDIDPNNSARVRAIEAMLKDPNPSIAALDDALDYLDDARIDSGDLTQRVMAKQDEIQQRSRPANANEVQTPRDHAIDAEAEYADHAFQNDDRFANRNSKAYKDWVRKEQELLAVKNETADGMFMRRQDVQAKDIADQTWEHLSLGYKDHGVVTDEMAMKAANEAQWTPETISKMRAAGDLKRMTFIYEKLADETAASLRYLNEKAQTVGLTGDETADLIETTAKHDYILGRLDNHGTQMARGLASMKAVTYSRNNLLKLRAELEKAGSNAAALTDPEEAKKFLANYINMLNGGNPIGANKMLTGVNSPYWWQYPLTWRQNMMLSGLSTQAKATVDMFTSQTREMGEKWIATGVGGVHPTEPAMQHYGMLRALLDAQTWKDAGNVFKQGGVSRHTQTADPRIPIVSKVNDALSAQDSFWKAIFTNGQLYALGTREARNQLGKGAKWDDITALGSSIAQNPTNKLMEEAIHNAETTILTNKSTVNTALDQAKLIRPNMSGMEQAQKFAINFMTPFMRTASNGLQEQVLRRTPIGFLSKTVRADLAAGGPRRAIALTKMAVGSSLIGYYWNASDPDNKKVTGNGPKSYAKVQELMASGWTPNATLDPKTGRYTRASNLNFSLNPLSTNNAIASTVAGAREAYESGAKDGDVANALAGAAYTTMRMLAEMTYVGDLADTFGAVTDRTASGPAKFGQFAAKELGSFYPNLATQAQNILDPNKHDTAGNGMVDSFTNNLPIANKSGPVKYNAYGQPMKTGTTVTGIPLLGAKGNGLETTKDPTEIELARLASVTPAAVITAVGRTIKVDGTSVKLTNQQFQDYQRDAGQQIVSEVRDLMESGGYEDLSDKDKIKAVKKIETRVKKEARSNINLNSKQQSKVDSEDSDDAQ